MPDTFRIAFVDLATPSLDDAVAYYRDVIGASVAQNDNTAAYLSLGLDHHNIALHAAPKPGLQTIGLQVGKDVALGDLQARLQRSGLDVTSKSDCRPGIGALLEVALGGHRFQLFQTASMPAPGFATTGIVPNRLAHVAVITPDAAKVVRFLTEELGFWRTDWFEEQVTFVTCNRDHHVLNVIEAPITGMHHMAFELRGRDHQVDAVDQLVRKNLPVVWGPSRHTAGHNLASYHYGADGALVELYTDMDVYLPDLDSFEARPWHEDLPQRPKHWALTEMTAWQTGFTFDMATVAWGV